MKVTAGMHQALLFQKFNEYLISHYKTPSRPLLSHPSVRSTKAPSDSHCGGIQTGLCALHDSAFLSISSSRVSASERDEKLGHDLLSASPQVKRLWTATLRKSGHMLPWKPERVWEHLANRVLFVRAWACAHMSVRKRALWSLCFCKTYYQFLPLAVD